MAISINWVTRVIYIPQDYLANLGGGNYGLDIDQFRLDLKDIEDSAEGMPFPDTHRHSTEVVLSGVTYARFVEIINGYTVEFENGSYVVVCTGANHNLADVKVLNSVSLIIGNSAGLITVVSGSGLSEEESEALNRIDDTTQDNFEELSAMATQLGEVQDQVQFIDDIEAGRWKIVNGTMIFYKPDNVTEVARFQLLDADGNPSHEKVFERLRVS